MILQRLYEYAERRRLVEDLDFETVPVRWMVCIDRQGKLKHLQELRGAEGQDKRNAGMLMSVPRRQKRSGKNPAPNFIADNPKFVLGIEIDKTGNRKKASGYCDRFAAQIAEAAKATGDEDLAIAAKFYDSDEVRKIVDHPALKAAAALSAADTMVLAVKNGTDYGPLSDRPAVRQWWSQRSEPAADQEATETHCLVTGEKSIAERLHPAIKGLYGGQPTGTSLVSFNLPAFESYGLEQSANAPVSRKAAIAYTSALNSMLSRDPEKRRSIVLPGGVTICVFSGLSQKRSSADPARVFIEALDPSTEDLILRDDGVTWRAVETLYGAPWSGKEPFSPDRDDTAIYTLALSANAARVVVRDWHEGTVSDVFRSLRQYFDDLAVVDPFTSKIRRTFYLRRPFRRKVEAGDEKAASAEQVRAPEGLLDALRGKGEQADVAPDVARHMVMAALDLRRPMALGLLEAAVRRIRAEAAASEYGAVSTARAAVIKAVLNRDLRRPGSDLRNRLSSLDAKIKEVLPVMDATCSIPAYLLGRLMAVMEKAQQEAISDANATVVDRAYGAASATPATVMPRLLRGVRHHLSKIRGEGQTRGKGVWFEKLLDEICSKFPDPASAFPTSLNLHEQGLFALGYYHQRAELWRKKDADAPQQ